MLSSALKPHVECFHMSDISDVTPSKKFSFCFVSLKIICPEVLGIIKMLFGESETSLCGVLWVSSGVLLGDLPWMSSLFLIFES